MPSFLFPDASWAPALEMAAGVYIFTPGNVFTMAPLGASVPLSIQYAAAAGLTYWAYHKFVMGKK